MYNFLRTYIVKIHYTVSGKILQDVFEKKLRQMQEFGKEWLHVMQQKRASLSVLNGKLALHFYVGLTCLTPFSISQRLSEFPLYTSDSITGIFKNSIFIYFGPCFSLADRTMNP